MLQFTRAIRKSASSMLSAASQLIFAHKVALPSYLFGSRFSCKHEIYLQKGTSELGGTTKIKWNPVYGIPARAASRVSGRFQIAALRIQAF